MIKRINITHLLEGEKRLNPVDIIIDYRFTRQALVDVVVSVKGTTNNSGYKTFGVQSLFKPIVWNDFNTDIFQLTQQICTGLWLEIDNAEYVEIKRIAATFNEASKLTGRKMDYDPDNRVAIVSYIINDGSIFSPAQTVVLNNVCIGNPTHYRASRFSDFIDTDWQTYSTNPTFDLYRVGVNRVYLQVKNANAESTVEQREVGWHGYEEKNVVDIADFSNISFQDSVSIVYADKNYDNIYQDSFNSEDVSFGDSVVIWKGEV